MKREKHASSTKSANGATSRRRRSVALMALIAVTLLIVIAWLSAGIHRVPGRSIELQVASCLLGGRARPLSEGWTLAPPLVCSIAVFPAAPIAVAGRWGAEPEADSRALKSREGVGLLAAGTLSLQADASRLAQLMAAFPAGWGHAGVAGITGVPGVNGQRDRVIVRALEAPIAGYSAATSFTDLIQARAGAPPALVQRLAELGLQLGPASTLRFYPAARTGPVGDGGPARPAGEPSHRVLLVGLDGADWEIIDPLMAQGKMPNMKRLVDTGVRARLKTITPVLSPIIWTSIATGVGPDKHGIMDFLATSKTSGNQIPVTSNMRKVKAVWNILTENGKSSGIVAWWATWPAEQIDGFIISDRVAFQLFGYPDSGESLRRRTFPEALGLVIHPLVVAPSEVTPAELARMLPPGAGTTPDGAELERKLKTIIASARTYMGIGMDLMSAYDPDFKAIYFEGTDTVAHNFMKYRPPAMPGVTQAQVAAYGGVVDRFYEYQDELLGKLLAQADSETVVIVCSDHGFRSGTNRPASDPRIEMGGAADWHRKFGILVVNGPGVRRGVTLEDASVLDITPTVLSIMGLPVAQDMTGRVVAEAFDPPPAVRSIATYENGPGPQQAGPQQAGVEPVGSAMDAEIVAKLTALGYVSQEGSNALNNTGITLMDRGRYSEAVDVFRRALQQEPRFLHARINLGRAQMLMKDHDAAIVTLQEVLRQDPSQAEVHNLLGNIYMDRGDMQRAEAAFKKCLEMEPDNTNAHNSLGLLYDKVGKDDQAIAQYRKVVAVDRDYAEGYNNIGLIHRKRGEPRKAIELFDQAIKADPDFPGSYNNMGLAYQDMGDLKQAREAFERGLKVDPDNAVILNNLGTVDLAERSLTAARDRFQQAIAADPEYPSAYNNLGAALGMLGEADHSFEQYLKAVELDPNYTDARFNLARYFLERHKNKEAIDMLEKLLKIDPRYGKALLQLGIVLAQQGDIPGAIERVNQAARELPESPDPHNLLADIYLSTGRTEDARRELKASLKLNPAQPKVEAMLKKLDSSR